MSKPHAILFASLAVVAVALWQSGLNPLALNVSAIHWGWVLVAGLGAASAAMSVRGALPAGTEPAADESQQITLHYHAVIEANLKAKNIQATEEALNSHRSWVLGRGGKLP